MELVTLITRLVDSASKLTSGLQLPAKSESWYSTLYERSAMAFYYVDPNEYERPADLHTRSNGAGPYGAYAPAPYAGYAPYWGPAYYPYPYWGPSVSFFYGGRGYYGRGFYRGGYRGGFRR